MNSALMLWPIPDLLNLCLLVLPMPYPFWQLPCLCPTFGITPILDINAGLKVTDAV